MLEQLQPNLTPGAQASQVEPGLWRLWIPAGPQGAYRLAQLDDYGNLPRQAFPHRAPFHLTLQVRASQAALPGTWGFGLWNNPFSLAVVQGPEVLRLPALPNTAWFFFAAPPNYLSLRDDLPAQGWLASTFQSPAWPPALLALGAPALPLLLFPPLARQARRLASQIARQATVQIQVDPTTWHTYSLDWQPGRVELQVDGATVLSTSIAPRGPLGFVLWIDNQYFAFRPDGSLGFGTRPNPEPAWIEVRE